MIISFDLDDTLFVSPNQCKTEKPLAFPLNLIYKERLRLGAKDLFQQLHEKNIETWIYTTSFRSEKYIRRLLRCYGIKVSKIVNGERHLKEVQRDKKEPLPSKYPSRYRIDLHVDDDISVAQNGKLYGFKVLIIPIQEDQWTAKVLQKAEEIMKRSNI